MPSIRYLAARIRRMDTARMRTVARELAAKAGKPAPLLFLDMIYCGFRYGAGYMDYRLFEFYNRTAAQRATYLTRGKSNALCLRFNDRERAALVEDKLEFCKRFRAFLGRDWLDAEAASDAELAAFTRKHPVFFAKTRNDCCGTGVRRVEAGEQAPQALRRALLQAGFALWEEPIVQHPAMAALCPLCVNTYRVVTLLEGDMVHILKVFLRMGNGGHVDNLNAGGFAAPVDAVTGRITLPAADKEGVCYTVHPATGAEILGFQAPLWQECLAMVRRAALVEPQVRYLGWDVAITAETPMLVEANTMPGNDITQMPAHTPGGVGMLPLFEKFL
ncbi:MAG: hypothetical protein LBC83_02735 [Oscillospiraceae bacterium]|jgi:hypothetical protein|nr:hypothetical protein [Oscillospiraceae bacterium]